MKWERMSLKIKALIINNLQLIINNYIELWEKHL